MIPSGQAISDRTERPSGNSSRGGGLRLDVNVPRRLRPGPLSHAAGYLSLHSIAAWFVFPQRFDRAPRSWRRKETVAPYLRGRRSRTSAIGCSSRSTLRRLPTGWMKSMSTRTVTGTGSETTFLMRTTGADGFHPLPARRLTARSSRSAARGTVSGKGDTTRPMCAPWSSAVPSAATENTSTR